MVNRAMEVRDRVAAEHFIDVSYYDLVADPLKEIRRIYDHLGLELGQATAERMQAFVTGNPQHRLGTHRYELADFGLERAGLDERFGAYRRRFDVPHE
jgi:hypothetical protein